MNIKQTYSMQRDCSAGSACPGFPLTGSHAFVNGSNLLDRWKTHQQAVDLHSKIICPVMEKYHKKLQVTVYSSFTLWNESLDSRAEIKHPLKSMEKNGFSAIFHFTQLTMSLLKRKHSRLLRWNCIQNQNACDERTCWAGGSDSEVAHGTTSTFRKNLTVMGADSRSSWHHSSSFFLSCHSDAYSHYISGQPPWDCIIKLTGSITVLLQPRLTLCTPALKRCLHWLLLW